MAGEPVTSRSEAAVAAPGGADAGTVRRTAAASPAAAPRPHRRVTPRDLEMLRFAGRMRFAAATQLARACGATPASARRRSTALSGLGLLRAERVLHGRPAVYLATRAGLGLSGCELPPARVDLLNFRHHLAVVSLALDLLEAHPGARWISERELRHELGARRGVGAPVHQPDGVLLLPRDGRAARVAVELELTSKSGRRMDRILRFYARTRDYDEARYFLTTPAAVERLRRLIAPYPYIRAELWTVPAEAGGERG